MTGCVLIPKFAFVSAAILLVGCAESSTSNVTVPESPATAETPGDEATSERIVHPAATESIAHPVTTAASLPGIVRWETVPPLLHDVAIMDTVFWEPADTESLRMQIFLSPDIKGGRILEIGTGSGLVSLCCLHAGAAHVVATDVNPNAIHNVRFNTIETFGDENRLDARLVPRRNPNAWAVIKPNERFDFIISNPPWENDKPKTVEEFALYDPDFLLLDSLVTGARQRLRAGGRMWLAYGCVTAIRRIKMLATQKGLKYSQLDERSLDDLAEVFLPGMLLELTVPPDETAPTSVTKAQILPKAVRVGWRHFAGRGCGNALPAGRNAASEIQRNSDGTKWLTDIDGRNPDVVLFEL